MAQSRYSSILKGVSLLLSSTGDSQLAAPLSHTFSLTILTSTDSTSVLDHSFIVGSIETSSGLFHSFEILEINTDGSIEHSFHVNEINTSGSIFHSFDIGSIDTSDSIDHEFSITSILTDDVISNTFSVSSIDTAGLIHHSFQVAFVASGTRVRLPFGIALSTGDINSPMKLLSFTTSGIDLVSTVVEISTNLTDGETAGNVQIITNFNESISLNNQMFNNNFVLMQAQGKNKIAKVIALDEPG